MTFTFAFSQSSVINSFHCIVFVPFSDFSIDFCMHGPLKLGEGRIEFTTKLGGISLANRMFFDSQESVQLSLHSEAA